MHDSDSARQWITTILFTAVMVMVAVNLDSAAELTRRHAPNGAPRIASAWCCIKAGHWDIGPFEPTIPSVRLSDLDNAHHCSTCKGGGR